MTEADYSVNESLTLNLHKYRFKEKSHLQQFRVTISVGGNLEITHGDTGRTRKLHTELLLMTDSGKNNNLE